MAQFLKKNIDQAQRNFLIFLYDKEIEIFTFSDIGKNWFSRNCIEFFKPFHVFI